MEFVIYGVIALVSFAAGVVVGIHNVPTVDKAIAAVKAAEASAKATVEKIAAHKAS